MYIYSFIYKYISSNILTFLIAIKEKEYKKRKEKEKLSWWWSSDFSRFNKANRRVLMYIATYFLYNFSSFHLVNLRHILHYVYICTFFKLLYVPTTYYLTYDLTRVRVYVYAYVCAKRKEDSPQNSFLIRDVGCVLVSPFLSKKKKSQNEPSV